MVKARVDHASDYFNDFILVFIINKGIIHFIGFNIGINEFATGGFGIKRAIGAFLRAKGHMDVEAANGLGKWT